MTPLKMRSPHFIKFAIYEAMTLIEKTKNLNY